MRLLKSINDFMPNKKIQNLDGQTKKRKSLKII